TKQRAPLLLPPDRARVHEYIGGILRGLNARSLITNGIDDHVHILAKLRQDHTLAGVMRDVKANSSRWIRSELANGRLFSWQRGYAAFSVSESQVGTVRDYIRRQEEHHRRLTYEEELEAMLKAHGIEYERAYLFD